MARGYFCKHEVNGSGWTKWIPAARRHKIRCCDCGLVHEFVFHINKHGVIHFKARRLVTATRKARRTILGRLNKSMSE